jgi:hypothetical protein
LCGADLSVEVASGEILANAVVAAQPLPANLRFLVAALPEISRFAAYRVSAVLGRAEAFLLCGAAAFLTAERGGAPAGAWRRLAGAVLIARRVAANAAEALSAAGRTMVGAVDIAIGALSTTFVANV